MRTFQTSFKPCESDSDNEYSFYSEDSYELIEPKLSLQTTGARLKDIKSIVPPLDLSQLPDYVSSEEEEEDASVPQEDQAHQ